jgi:hypothetical protein
MHLYNYCSTIAEIVLSRNNCGTFRAFERSVLIEIDCRLADTGTQLELEYLACDDNLITRACRKVWRERL